MLHEYKFDISLNNKDISSRAFNLEEYLRLVTARSTGYSKDSNKELRDIVYACSGIDVYDLPKSDAEYLIFMIWVNSVGEVNHEAEYRCSCGQEMSLPMNFNHIQRDKERDYKKVIGNLTLHFKPPKVFGDDDEVFTFLDCLDYIIFDGEQIFSSDLSEEETKDLQSIITYDIIDEVCDYLLEPTIHLGIPVKCPKCGAYHVEEINTLDEFMRVIS